MSQFGYIGRTAAWYGDYDNDSLFVPEYWKWVDDPDELCGDVHELTEEGNDLLEQWCDDAAVGYDLCYGRAKGLAAEYNREQIYAKITGSETYSIPICDD